ncbi:hypothetical protein C8R43DRAFT_962099 [Mycena crocata]|nr:hypothetical protein C8R43DRAFT_962099 [Mycena crocata]
MRPHFGRLRNVASASLRPMGAVFASHSVKRSKCDLEFTSTVLTSDTPDRRADGAGTYYDVTQRGIAEVRPKLRESVIVKARSGRTERTDAFLGLLNGVCASLGPGEEVFARVSEKRSSPGGTKWCGRDRWEGAWCGREGAGERDGVGEREAAGDGDRPLLVLDNHAGSTLGIDLRWFPAGRNGVGETKRARQSGRDKAGETKWAKTKQARRKGERERARRSGRERARMLVRTIAQVHRTWMEGNETWQKEGVSAESRNRNNTHRTYLEAPTLRGDDTAHPYDGSGRGRRRV